ncbi:MAG TPA: peptide deformylase [Patescibacteria group bacterium]|nr:peptide deformylase [Patescibacteria group bacterium]
MSKPIITVPNPVLRAKSRPVDTKHELEQVTRVIRDLEDALEKKRNPRGVGLSLPQIGKSLRVFSTLLPASANTENGNRPDDEEKEKSILQTYINPEIIATAKDTTFGPEPKDPIFEGCLSIPLLYGPVPRFSWVTLRYMKPDMTEEQNTFYGFFARVIQHEFDHLEGVLFTDYIRQLDLPLFEFRKTRMVEIDKDILAALG